MLSSLSPDGELDWASFERQFSETLRNPNAERQLELQAGELTIKAFYAGLADNNLHLFRLVTPKKTKPPETLQDELSLTKREAQVLYWVSFGKTNWEVAQILDMSPRTVTKHLEQIFRKLDVDNRTSAANIAIRVLEND